MSRRRLLVLLKPGNVYIPRSSDGVSRVPNPRILSYLENRCKVHLDAIKFCQDILRRKAVDWEPIWRSDLVQTIRDVDLVVTIGGDGTLLQASHFMDDSIPVLGVNSDPTQVNEVEEFSDEFDATRSTGYLCAATAENFEQVLDDIVEGHRVPYKLTRISIRVNSQLLSTYALNDVLIAHPCPAAVSWFSYRVKGDGQLCYPLVNCRSSGLRICTAAGSTAAMLSGGGFRMPILSEELQFMVGMAETVIPFCSCGGGKMILKISHTKKNPNRKFLKCPVNGEHERCFIWLDELQRISTFSSTSYMTDGASNNERNKPNGNYQELHRVLLYHLLGLFIFLLVWVFLLTCYVIYITSVKLG